MTPRKLYNVDGNVLYALPKSNGKSTNSLLSGVNGGGEWSRFCFPGNITDKCEETAG